jgi:hypothetical protein
MKFLVGTAKDGPFTGFDADNDQDAQTKVEINWGEILDIVDWTDDFGRQVDMFIVGEEQRTCIKCGVTDDASKWPPCPQCDYDARSNG